MTMRPRLFLALCLALASASACATALAGTSTPARESDALYRTALLHASPGRPTYDPDRAAELLAAFIERFPMDPRRPDAGERLALVNEIRSLRAELRALKAIDLARPPR